MANVAISALVAIGAGGSPASQPASGDLLPFVRISDSTQSPGGSTKKMTIANLFTSPTFTGTVGAAAITATGTVIANALVSSTTLAAGVTTVSQLNISATGTELAVLTNTTVAGSLEGIVQFRRGSGGGLADVAFLGIDASSNLVVQTSTGSVALTFDHTAGRNISLGTIAPPTSAVGTLSITNGTAPSANPSGGGTMWVEAGILKYRGSAGTITSIASA